MIEIDNVIDKNYSFIRESVHSFHLKRKECPRMKRNALNLLCMGLAFLIGVLLTPVDAYERDEMLSDNEWSYEQYFKNEHGFYSDDITKKQAYFAQLPQLFRKSISKSSEGLLLYNGNSISGMVGNAEMGFFSVGHTVYRYHVKSKVSIRLAAMWFCGRERKKIRRKRRSWIKRTLAQAFISLMIFEMENHKKFQTRSGF